MTRTGQVACTCTRSCDLFVSEIRRRGLGVARIDQAAWIDDSPVSVRAVRARGPKRCVPPASRCMFGPQEPKSRRAFRRYPVTTEQTAATRRWCEEPMDGHSCIGKTAVVEGVAYYRITYRSLDGENCH